MEIEIGIIILNYNSEKYTSRCVDSVLNKAGCYKFKIFIVDNKSSDDSLLLLHSKYDQIESVVIIHAAKNGGYSYGNNIGIKCAINENIKYIIIANPDTYLLNDAIYYLIKELEQNNDVSVAGPYLEQPDGHGQFARSIYTYKKAVFSKAPFRWIKYFRNRAKRDLEWKGELFSFEGMVAGCFFAVKVQDFRDEPLFDQSFFLYNEEDVIAYKLQKMEKKSVIVPTAKVYHDHAVTTKKEGMPFVYYHYRISDFLLLCKYANINFMQKIIFSMINILWFFLYCIKEQKARPYFIKMFRVYIEIFRGRYECANEAISKE